jgi:hypothetical protein
MMNCSRSRSSTFRPSLEVLEERDVPSVAGVALYFAVPSFVSQSNAASTSWTASPQSDFITLQQNIQTQGWTATTVGSLSKVMSDYGSAEQTYNFASHISSLLETGLLMGAASGVFDAGDAIIWWSAWTQLRNLDNTVSHDAGVANGIASTSFNTPSGLATIAALAS